MLAWLLVVLLSGPAAEARRGGHRHHGGHAFWSDPVAYPGGVHQHTDGDIDAGTRRDTGLSGAVRQIVTGCRQAGAELKRLSVDNLAKGLAANDGQRATLSDMQAVAAQVADGLSSACPSDLPASASGKMQALAEVARAYLATIDVLQPKMQAFYGSLTDEQKARLVVLDLSNRGIDVNASITGDVKGTAFCDEWAQALRGWPIRQVEARLSLSDSQHAALFDVAAAMYRAADALANACPKEMPLSPPGQFDARRKQVAAFVQAIKDINPVLERFSSALDDGQKTVFDSIVNAS